MTLTLDTLEKLVGFDTVSAQPNADIIAYIQEFLTLRGARCRLIPSHRTGKLGLYAEIGPQAAGGILLSGHTDVVPVAGQRWSRDPFVLARENDRLFGRGTTDMKGYLACMLNAADLASRTQLQEPLKLVFSYDEEVGCVGIQEMLDRLPDLIGTPRACFVGEPTQMQVAIGHKGKAALEAVCTGEAGHSALAPQFVNAVHIAADLIAGLRELQQWLRANGAQDAAYDIPYSTLHVGKMSGGTALNIVPDYATILFEYRHLAYDAPDMIMAQLRSLAQKVSAPYRAAFSGAGVEITQTNAYPGLATSLTSEATKLAQRLLNTHSTTKVAFGTEAGFFDALGCPTIVCGPGSMAGQGHKADEYIDLAQLDACDRMLAGVVAQLRP